jgi:hypothetical protein
MMANRSPWHQKNPLPELFWRSQPISLKQALREDLCDAAEGAL